MLSALALQRDAVVHHVCVRELPRSGPPAALLQRFGISAAHVASAVRRALEA